MKENYLVIYQMAGDITSMYEGHQFSSSLEAKLFADALTENEHFKNVKIINL